MTLSKERKLKLMQALEMVEDATMFYDKDDIDDALMDMPRLRRMLEDKFRRLDALV